MPGDRGEKTKHDRCVEGVKEGSPGVNNPHAVCVAAGVRPDKWKLKKGDEILKVDSQGQWSIEKQMLGGGDMNPHQDITKDDKPHKARSPEDSAHDVVEEGEKMSDEMKNHKDDEAKRVLAHLRTKKDESWNRSEKNRKIGKD